MKLDWSKAPPDALAGTPEGEHHFLAWYKKDLTGFVHVICPGQYITDWVSMGGRHSYPEPHELRPVDLPGDEPCEHSYSNRLGCPECGAAFRSEKFKSPNKIVPTPPAWNGEGLPPVGAVCRTTDKGRGFEVKILAYAGLLNGRQAVMVENVSPGTHTGELHSWVAHMCEFRPVRTAEQIAAEDKQNAWLAAIAAECDQQTADKCAAVLVAGGYRKKVEP